MTNILHLHISDINLSLQFRHLSEETVSDYAYALSQKEELPDVTVAFDRETGTYYMVDGFHRLAAHKRNGGTMITATVTTMPKQDARWLSLGANAKNGRRLSIEDQRAAIVLALQEFPTASSRAIAVHIGCSHSTVLRVKESGGADVPTESTPLLDADEPGKTAGKTAGSRRQAAAEEDDDEKPERVVGTDGKSYPAKKEKPGKPKPMTSFGELAASFPYSHDEQVAAQAVVDAVFALPVSLTLRIHEGRLIITSTDSDKPTLRDCPLQREMDWKNYPIRPFFKFSAADSDLLENGGICTVGDLATLITSDPKEHKTLPKFGKKKLEHLEKQFEDFWMAHPELCEQ
jgi:hypothetical protein